jgi:beta-galactosidase
MCKEHQQMTNSTKSEILFEQRFPFLFGTQYYRAPTPDPECWEQDFRAMQELGFNAVKFFVQWRWSHRAPGRFYFDDLDQVMDLAAQHGLGVTLNFILDVSPVWLFDVYPDAKQIDIRGHSVEPYAVSHRQIGGHPGPCYNHPGALAERQQFVAAGVEHYRDHPALQMWDVWNEPELCFPQRTPDMNTMVCYCPHCARRFRDWLTIKYGSLDRLNAVWGRCYETWQQVELPRGTGTITDFVDWREFHLDTMTGEAAWRLQTVEKLDPTHGRYLHVVPNSFFSAVTCADDFAMAEHCEVFAATMTGGPGTCMHVISAGRGKVCYNVESHLNHGCTDMHQPIVQLAQLKRDLLPQFGMGIKGVLFWQYRSEVLGFESPAWGLVKTDGSPRPVTAAVQQFWSTLKPLAAELRRAHPKPAEIGIWRSRKNEIFHFCAQGQVNSFNAALEAYIQTLYWNNLPFVLINDRMLAEGKLTGIKLLIMPACYYVTQEEADALVRWVQAGGVLLCEAHLAGYNGTTGRHSQSMPGGGLAGAWGIREIDTTSPRHLQFSARDDVDLGAVTEDVRKALKEFGSSGSEYFPIQMTDGTLAWGAHRYATLAGDGLVPLGSFGADAPCLARKTVGTGSVFYCGTNLGDAAAGNRPAGLHALLHMATAAAGIKPTGLLDAEVEGTVHVDILYEKDIARFAVLINKAEHEQTTRLHGTGQWRGMFTGIALDLGGEGSIRLPAGFVELFQITQA